MGISFISKYLIISIKTYKMKEIPIFIIISGDKFTKKVPILLRNYFLYSKKELYL